MKRAVLRINVAAVLSLLLSIPAFAKESALNTYVSVVREGILELPNTLRGLSMYSKASILAAIIFVALIFYLRTRDTHANNIRRARNLHRKGLELHEKGDEEEAARYYELASQYRQKAVERQ